MFPSVFRRFTLVEQCAGGGDWEQSCGIGYWVCIGRRGIPAVGGGEKLKAERPASRAIIAFYGSRPPLGGFTQEMGFLFTAVEECGVDACGRSRKAGEE